MGDIHTNNPMEQEHLINDAEFYLLLKERYKPLIGKELIVSDDWRLPKEAVITGFEVRVGAIEQSEKEINSMEDFAKFDVVHEIVHVKFYAIFDYKGEGKQIYFFYLFRLNPHIYHKI